MKNFDEERLVAEYAPKKKTGLDEAIRLDRKAKLPALILAYSLGIIGALVLGVGMCLAMEVIGGGTLTMAIGVVIGIIGIVMVGVNYPIYTKVLRLRKEKFASSILLAINKDKKPEE